MFGFLKNLMGGKGEPAKPAAAPPAPAKPAPPAEAKPEPKPEAKAAPAPAAPQKAASPAAAPAAAPAPPPAASVPVENVSLTVAGIIKKFPEQLQAKVKKKPGAHDTVTIPIKKLAEQLQQGSVKITLGELVKASPAGSFVDTDANDQTMIELPLAEILTKIDPKLMTRRANQKKIDIPSDVVGLFSSSGGAASAPVAPAAPAPAPAPAAPAPAPAPAPVAAAPAPAPEPPAPAPVPAPPPPPPEPAQPIQISSSLRDMMSAASAAAAATPTPPTKPPAPAAPAPAAPKLPAAAPSPASAAAPAAAEGSVNVPISAVSGAWPDAIKQEVAKLSADAVLEIPSKNLGDSLRMGKVAFAWKMLRGWVRPSPISSASSQDDTVLELPISVVAPLFMASKPQMRAQRKLVIDEKIPDMFAGRAAAPPPPAEPPPAAPAAPTPAPVPAAPAPAPAPAPAAPAPAPVAAAAPAADIGAILGQPGKTAWTPKEIVQKTATLPGVAGALIALQDGLVVESQLPGTLKGETVAGFLPQIFSRINQYTVEMSLGELNGLILIVNHVPWQIYKSGNIFFAALGRAGETLPTAQLNIIAAELGRQNNK